MNSKDTLIKDIRIYRSVSKLSRPIADSTHALEEIAFYVLEVRRRPVWSDRAICCSSITVRRRFLAR